MTEKYEVHNHSSGLAGTTVQFGVNNGVISFDGSSDRPREERLRDLAAEVRSASERELEKWGLRGRDALPVRWHTAEDDLFDHWTKIQDNGVPVSLDGQFTGIRPTYEAVESRRLVILGRAGSGKTVLAHRFILDLLANSSTCPVPVLFSLGDWNPTTDLRSWLAEHLVRDFPFLDAPDASGKKLAEIFVLRGLILPVLDGFDEIPVGHQPAAIRRIGSLNLPLILTSRPGEYARAAHEVGAVGGAAAIALQDLTLDESHEYLRQSTGKPRSHTWDAAFEHLRTTPDDLASRNLTAVLTSPLMVMLTRTVYNDKPGHQPAELLDTERFPTVQALEDRLLDAYVDTVYDEHPPSSDGGNTTPPSWTPDQARRWLGFLADHLTHLKTHDLAWWQLGTALPRHTRILVTALVGLVFAITFTVTIAVEVGPWRGAARGLENGATYGLAVGIAFGVAIGLINEIGFSRGRSGHPPERLRLRLRRQGRSRRPASVHLARAATELAVGLSVGLGVGLTYGFTYEFRSETGSVEWTSVLGPGLWSGIVFGAVFGLANVAVSALGNDRATTIIRIIAAVLVIGLGAGLKLGNWLGAGFGIHHSIGGISPTDWLGVGLGIGIMFGTVFGLANVAVSALGDSQNPQETTDPWHQLTTDRKVTLVRITTAVLAVGLVFGLVNGISAGRQFADYGLIFFALSSGLTNGITYGLAAGLALLVFSAWGNWLLFARLWLPLTGRLPWRPQRFLEDAYNRGILRRVGAAYQFRHARLRDYLATQAGASRKR